MLRQTIPLSYYKQENVKALAKDLLGKFLFTHLEGQTTGGMITETEAYAGTKDKASHAYNGRRTARTEIMYAEGGVSYVYFTYGMHHLFNVVTGKKEVPHAVLIRALFPLVGMETMMQRTGKSTSGYHLTNGPAKMTKALAITKQQNGLPLDGDTLWLENHGIVVDDAHILTTSRIGVDYADEDAKLPYRFVLDFEPYLLIIRKHQFHR